MHIYIPQLQKCEMDDIGQRACEGKVPEDRQTTP